MKMVGFHKLIGRTKTYGNDAKHVSFIMYSGTAGDSVDQYQRV